MSRETLDRLKAQIAEQMRIHGENARDSGFLRGTALPIIDRQIREDALMPEELAALANVYPVWQAGEAVSVDDLRSYGGMLWKAITAHTTQADWKPDVAVSLWVRTAPPDVIPEWRQPLGAHDAYPVGYEVTLAGDLYVNERPANVSQPGTFDSGWTLIEESSSETEPEIAQWNQPGSVNPEGGVYPAYNTNDEVIHDNPNDGGNIWVYRSKIDSNTTEPGRDGTFDRWWEPVRLV